MRSATRSKKHKDKKYLEWLALQPSIVPSASGFTTLHHVKRCPGGPREDRRAIPLPAHLHMLTHEIPGQICVERSRKKFEEYWDVDLEAEIVKLNARYEAEMG